MVERYAPEPDVLYSLIQKARTTDNAVAEWIDNSFGDGAGNSDYVRVEFHSVPGTVKTAKVVVVDHGLGVADMGAMFVLGRSGSRHIQGNIGLFGIGSKEAALHFGTHVTVETVHAGRYHSYTVDWQRCIDTKEWPPVYRYSGQHVLKAPAEIQNGGTIITVQNIHDWYSKPYFEPFCEKLSNIYRPGLKQGKRIEVNWYGQLRSVPAYGPKAEKLLSSADQQWFEGEAAGRPFKVMVTLAQEYSPALHGLHIGYGYRFVRTETKLNNKALPNQFYAEVMLGDAWKDCLSPEKNEIVRHKAELYAAISALIKDWIDLLAEMAQEVRIERILADLSGKTTMVLNPLLSGDAGKRPRANPLKVVDGDKPDKPDDKEKAKPQPHDPPMPLAVVGGDKYAQPADRRRPPATGIKFRQIGKLGMAACKTKADGDGIMIDLNSDHAQIMAAFEHPFRMDVLWPIICHALAAFAVNDREEFAWWMPGYEKVCELTTSPGDENFQEELVLNLFGWLLSRQPSIKEPKLKAVV